MKHSVLSFLLLSLIGCSEQGQLANIPAETRLGENWKDLVVIDGLVCLDSDKVPYSGWTQSRYPEGNSYVLAVFKNGLLVRVKRWHENGNAQLICSFTGGKVSDLKRLFEDEKSKLYLDPEYLAQGEEMELYRPWRLQVEDLNQTSIQETRPNGLLSMLSSRTTPTTKDGALIMWHSNGNMMLSVEYLLGAPNGLWANWTRAGLRIREFNVKNGRLDGKLVVYHQSQLGGRKVVQHFSEGKPTGSWTKRLANRQLIEKYSYCDGVRHGAFTEWHQNGKRARKGSYREGQLHGPFFEYTKLGKIKLCLLYDEGEKIGVARTWYTSGGRQMNFSRNDKGQLDGRWQSWHENGRIKTRREYRDGLLLSAKTWSQEGMALEDEVRDGDGILIEILSDGSLAKHSYEDGKVIFSN